MQNRLKNPVNITLFIGGILLLAAVGYIRPLLPVPVSTQTYPLLLVAAGSLLAVTIRLLPGDLWPPLPTAVRDHLGRVWRIRPLQLVFIIFALALGGIAYLAAGPNALARDALLSRGSWLLSIGLAVAGVWPTVKDGRFPGNIVTAQWPIPPWEQRDTAAALGFFVLGLLLRATYTADFPSTFSGDEGSAGLAAVQFITGQTDNLLGLGWFSFPNLYFWVQSFSIDALERTIFAARLPSAVAGALTVTGIYVLLRDMFSRLHGVCAALMLAAAHFHVHFSRIALNNIWDGLFAVLAAVLLWRGWHSGRRRWFVAAGLVLGLSQYFYVSMRAFPLLVMVWAGCGLLLQRKRLFRRFPEFVITALVSLVVFLPLGLLFLNHPDEFFAPMRRVTIWGEWLAATMGREKATMGEVLWQQIGDSFRGLVVLPLRHWYQPRSPLLLLPGALLFLVGLVWSLIRPSMRILLLMLPVALNVLVSALSNDVPAAQRYIIAAPFAVALAGTALAHLATAAFTYRPQRRKAITITAVGIAVAIALYNAHFYFRVVPDYFVLGGANTQVATAVAEHLRAQPHPSQTAYFIGGTRMSYTSHATIPFLATDTTGHTLGYELEGPPTFDITEPTIFIVLPEQIEALDHLQVAYPNGDFQAHHEETRRQVLFLSYTVSP